MYVMKHKIFKVDRRANSAIHTISFTILRILETILEKHKPKALY